MIFTEILIDISSKQHGAVARYQLIDEGINRNSITHLIRKKILVRVTHGVYTMIGSTESWEQRAVIATLSCGREGYLSHESVLMLFNLLPKDRNRISRRRTNTRKNTLIHVTTPRREYHKDDIYFHRSTCLDIRDKSLSTFGIRHVSVERALIDCAQQLTKYELDYVIDNALSRGLINLKHMRTLLSSLHTAPGREKKRTKSLLEPYFQNGQQPASESSLEKRIQTVLSEVSPYPIKKQHPAKINGRMYRIDLAISEKMIAIEVDGFAHHSSRTKFDNDRQRQNDLIGAGWKLARFTAKSTNEEIRVTFFKILSL